MPGPERILFIFPGIGPSLNEVYAGTNPMQRKAMAKKFHAGVEAFCQQQEIKPYAGPYPVHVRCCGYFGMGSKRMDADNLALTAKLIVDGLRHAHVIKGDSPRFVSDVTLTPLKHPGKGDFTVIELREAVPSDIEAEALAMIDNLLNEEMEAF